MPTPRPGLLLTLFVFLCPAFALAEDRRRDTPGIILDTNGRTGSCDALAFTPDGKQLFAAGDDKVVRFWNLLGAPNNLRLEPVREQTLRWPIFREQRGAIYSVVPEPGKVGLNARMLIGGIGLHRDRGIALINRATREVEQMPTLPTSREIWRTAWSPDGRYIACGDANGEIFLWTPDPKGSPVVKFAAAAPPNSRGRVRLLAFRKDNSLLCVRMDGRVFVYDPVQPARNPRSLGTLDPNPDLIDVFDALPSPDGKWLAATFKTSSRARLYELGPDAVTQKFALNLPDPEAQQSLALAWSPDGRLAVGAVDTPRLTKPGMFHQENGGTIYLYTTAAADATLGPRLGNVPQGIAFHPTRKELLATAGGDDHEITLWDLNNLARPVAEVSGPGACLWGVGLSADSSLLAFQQHRAPVPAHPNQRGKGSWRCFDLKALQFVETPDKFEPVPAKPTLAGWRIDFTIEPSVWNVVAPDGTATALKGGLYKADINDLPRCYTFFEQKGKPRLAVGHMWGISVYDLVGRTPVLARLLVGHEGPVMAIAPSKNGSQLVTASRDQTLAGWSLAPWEAQPEFGASFTVKGGKLFVGKIDPGSPGWEAGLSTDDEIELLITATGDYYSVLPLAQLRNVRYRGELLNAFLGKPMTADAAARLMAEVKPGVNIVFKWKTPAGVVQFEAITTKQRPLWRMFPLREQAGNEFVIFRARDWYYHGSDTAAREVGWQWNPDRDDASQTPKFYPLAGFSHGERSLQSKDKVVAAIQDAIVRPERPFFADIAGPKVRLVSPVGQIGAGGQVNLTLDIELHDKKVQREAIDRVSLWVRDHKLRDIAVPALGGTGLVVPLTAADLSAGKNVVQVLAYNKGAVRGQAEVTLEMTAKADNPRLFALCVGVNDYTGSKDTDGQPLANLKGAVNNVELIQGILKGQKILYPGAVPDVRPLLDRKVTANSVRSQLAEIQAKATKEDLFVLYLAGRSHAPDDGPDAGRWAFCPHDADLSKRETLLDGEELTAALGSLACRKMVLVESSIPGQLVARALNREVLLFAVITACSYDEVAPEESEQPFQQNVGLFTGQFILGVRGMGNQPARVPAVNGVITLRNLVEHLRVEIPRRRREVNTALRKINAVPADKKTQTLTVAPIELPAVDLFKLP